MASFHNARAKWSEMHGGATCQSSSLPLFWSTSRTCVSLSFLAIYAARKVFIMRCVFLSPNIPLPLGTYSVYRGSLSSVDASAEMDEARFIFPELGNFEYVLTRPKSRVHSRGNSASLVASKTSLSSFYARLELPPLPTRTETNTPPAPESATETLIVSENVSNRAETRKSTAVLAACKCLSSRASQSALTSNAVFQSTWVHTDHKTTREIAKERESSGGYHWLPM
jgi:hypothetical protein